MVIISFWIDWFYFQSLQQGLRGKSREKIIAILSENGKLIAASLAAKIGQGCPRIVLCSRNVLFREHNVYAGYSSVDFPIFEP